MKNTRPPALGRHLPSGRTAASAPSSTLQARPAPPRSLVAPACGPLTRMPCSTRTRSSSSIPKDTLRLSLLSMLPIAGSRRGGVHATRLHSNEADAKLWLPGLGLQRHNPTKPRFIGRRGRLNQSVVWSRGALWGL